MTLPHLGMTWIDMGLSADQAKPRSVRRAGFKGYVAGSDWEEQEEENGHGHSDLDEDLYDQVRPNPTSHEQKHYDLHDEYPDSFYDRHDKAYGDAIERRHKENIPDHIDDHLGHFVAEHSVDRQTWGRARKINLSKGVYATQSHVGQFHVDRYRNNPKDTSWHSQTGGQTGDYAAEKHPLFVTHRGRLHCIDGHHRVAAALQDGKTEMVGYHHNLDEHPVMKVAWGKDKGKDCEECKEWQGDAPHHFASFVPTKRVFTHTCGLDHRLFDENAHLRPDVRRYIMSTMRLWWSQSYEKWSVWSQVYFAGSEASEWTSDTLEGNNDFDVLVGVDYEGFKENNPTYKDWTNQQITDAMNLGFRAHNGPTMIVVDGTPYGPFDRTTYVNPDSYDIRKIKPYAAYNVSKDKWAIRPPHLPHWSIDEMPKAVVRVLRACDRLANDILKLPEPERTQQGAALFDAWHSDRSRAFGPNGEGWYDIANLREKWLDQEGVWAEIVNCKHRFNEGLGAASIDWSNTPPGYKTAGANGVLPEGIQYHHRNVGLTQQISAWHPEGSPLPHNKGYIGHITWWNDDGEVTDINVHPKFQRRGLATELWRRAREIQPDLRHSDNQTDAGKAWAPRVSSKQTETLDEIGRKEHPNVDHYMSGGIGHLEGDETRSVVGFMPTKFMKRYREHPGDWNGEHSEEVVHGIRNDIQNGKGIHTPLMVHYSDDDKWGYIGEGNHRLRAADEEGLKTVPVRVVRGGPVGEKRRRGIGAPMDLGGRFNEDHNGRVYPYVPSDIHPYHFLKESKIAVHIDNYEHDSDRIWYHGSPNKFDQFDQIHPGQSGDWNASLGHHFTSEEDVAKGFGNHQYRVKLNMRNPKIYDSEEDMDNEVMMHEHARGNHYTKHLDPSFGVGLRGNAREAWKADENLRNGEVDKATDFSHHWISKHPDRKGIIDRFRQRLEEAGHDGIVYGNDWENPGHASAIAFPGNPIVPLKRPKGYGYQRTSSIDDLYGSNDLDKLFGDRLTTPTPFKPAGRVKSHKDYDEALVARSITHPHEFPVEDVDPRELRSRQPSVTRDGVSHYFHGGLDYGRQNGDQRLGNDIPRIYHREDGQKIILSGHHRATSALLKGEPLKAMIIKGPWGPPR
jgi:ribosomal protein S18 acetylase RimI-like enzyme